MPDSTQTQSHRQRARQLARAVAPAALLALASGWSAAPARADGDPASDVLAAQRLFLPQDARLPAEQQAQLGALLEAARRSGYEIRVALIASSTDLGAVTELWLQPQSYAQFLGQELSFVYGGPLLVVMPNGFGLYRLHEPLAAAQSEFAGLHPFAAGAALGSAALTAIQGLAAASGHALPLPTTAIAPRSRASDAATWAVFVAGGVLIALAWIASLRARPSRGPVLK